MTPWPFAVHQVPRGLAVGAADAAETISPVANAAAQQKNAIDLARLSIEPNPWLSTRADILFADGLLRAPDTSEHLCCARMKRSDGGNLADMRWCCLIRMRRRRSGLTNGPV